jgi:hypothetical protein
MGLGQFVYFQFVTLKELGSFFQKISRISKIITRITKKIKKFILGPKKEQNLLERKHQIWDICTKKDICRLELIQLCFNV